MPMRQSRRARILKLFSEYTVLVAKAEMYSTTSVRWTEYQEKAAAKLALLRTEINNALYQEEDINYRIGQQRVDLMQGSLDNAITAIGGFRLAVRINSALPPAYNLPELPNNVIRPQDPEEEGE